MAIDISLAANIFAIGLAADGRFAFCQTANAPGPDGNRLFLFDVAADSQRAAWQPESGWPQDYRFETDPDRLVLIGSDGDEAWYDLDGHMIDRPGWIAARIAGGDLRAPGDQLHASQSRLISTILTPLGYDVAIAEVRAA